MSEIVPVNPFDALGASMRFGVTADGTPFVIGADMSSRLGYRSASDAARLLDDDEKGTQIVRTPGGDQRVLVFYEDGIWELLFQSRKPEAKAIKKRVKEILAALRRGETVGPEGPSKSPAEIAADLTRRDLAAMVIAEADRADAEHAARMVEAAKARAAEEKVAELAPKAAAADVLIDAHGTWTMGVLGNMLGLGRTTLFRRLYEEKILIEKERRPYQDYASWFRVSATTRDLADGSKTVDYVSYIYPDGAVRLYNLLVRRGYTDMRKPVVGGQLALIEGQAS